MTNQEPFVSHYDPRVFRTNIYSYADTTTGPVRDLITDPIHLTITVKDIGLEGLDSSSPDKAYNIRARINRQKQERLNKMQSMQRINAPSRQIPVSRPSTVQPQLSPRIKKMFGRSARLIPIYEGTFYNNNNIINTNDNSNDPKPIGLLSSSQKVQKPQTVIPKACPRTSPRLNASESASECYNEKPGKTQ